MAAAMAGTAVLRIVVSSDSMKNATATSQGSKRLPDVRAEGLEDPSTAGLTRAPRSSDLPVVWKLAPTLFVHFNTKGLRSVLNPLPRFVALGIGDVLHLIEPGDRIPDVRGVVEGFLLRVGESIAGFRNTVRCAWASLLS
jgi:hypothetical protein